MKKTFTLFAFLIFTAGCLHQAQPPLYYNTSIASESTAKFDLGRSIKFDSLNLELLEWAVFSETNIQRQRLGLPPLKYEQSLQEGARQHSEEMNELSYFDHISPVKKNENITKRLNNVGIKHGRAGENIAVHPALRKQQIEFRLTQNSNDSRYLWRNSGSEYTYEEFAKDLVRRWLNSKAHRHNILNKRYKFLGVGAAPGIFNDTQVFYVTQNFSSTNY